MNKFDWETYFKNKKITQLGLGLLGRGAGDAEFLAECGADLIVTDLKTEKELVPSVQKLKNLKTSKLINFHLGGHQLEDFKNKDFILKGAGVPLDSPYIAEARKNGIPIEMDASLFVKLAPKNVKVIGVTGTRGKTTTTMLIYEILKRALNFGLLGLRGKDDKERNLREVRFVAKSLTSRKSKVFLAGNVKDMATLPLLEEIKENDYVVAELDSWQLQGFGEAKISPNVSVWTNFFDDHLNYYKNDRKAYFADKANIFKYQNKGDVLIAGEQVAEKVFSVNPPVSPAVARAADFPHGWHLKLLGEHNRANAMCAILAARALKIPDEITKEVIENFGGVSGRLEFIREINGIKIYNDTTATTPEATLAALRALQASNPKSEIRNPKQIQNSKFKTEKNIVLIIGGSDKGLDMGGLVKEIPKWCKAVFLLKESGTEKIKPSIMKYAPTIAVAEKETLVECVKSAMTIARKGDVVLFSPAFASFGKWFKNEYDRGEQFLEIVRKLKSF